MPAGPRCASPRFVNHPPLSGLHCIHCYLEARKLFLQRHTSRYRELAGEGLPEMQHCPHSLPYPQLHLLMLLRLEYTMQSGALLYGSISNGYRSGGFNLGTTAPGVDSFKHEKITAYEVGYKGSVLDDSLLFELAAYYYDYSDLQVQQSFIDPESGTQGTEFTNAAEASVKGFEAQFTWLPMDKITNYRKL